MTQPLPGRLALYARKSSESEDRQILSIDSQVRELQEFALREQLGVRAVFTESKSAKAPGRPVFNQLLHRIAKGEFSGILCWKLDRLSRNPVDGGALIWAMEEKRLAFIHTPQRTLCNTGNDKFWMQLEFGMAKKYVDDLSDNVKRGLRARLAAGWSSGLPPLGYLNDRNTGTILRDSVRFPLVRRMWDLLLQQTYTPYQIVDLANDKWGFRTRQLPRLGGKPLSRTTIYNMFGNPFYYGAIRVNGQIHPGRHEAMISKSEFDKAQGILKRNDRPRPAKFRFAYTGLMKCGECGVSVTAEHRINPYGSHYLYYHCGKSKPEAECTQGVIDVRILEGQIVKFLDSVTITQNYRHWIISILRELHTEESEKDEHSLASLNRRHLACTDELTKLLDLRLREVVSDEDYVTKKNQLEVERFRLKELIDDADDSFSRTLAQCEATIDFVARAKSRFLEGGDEERRAIMTQFGTGFILKGGVLTIEPHRPFELIQSALAKTPSLPSIFKLTLERKESINKGEPAPEKVPTRIRQDWRAALYALRTFYHENPTFFNLKNTLT